VSRYFEQLRQQLLAPAMRLSAEQLLDIWQHDDVIVETPLPPDFEDCPDLNLRLRGAWLRQLHARRLERPRLDDPFERPAGWQLLYEWEPPTIGALRLARPFVVHSRIRGTRLQVCVRLFGRARWHAPEVQQALLAAMEGGVRLKARGIHVALAVQQSWIARTDGLAYPPHVPTTGMLRMESPLQVRRGKEKVIDPVAILLAAARRVAAVAPWMDAELLVDWAQLRACCEGLLIRMAQAHDVHFLAHSIRQRDVPVPVRALGGALHMSGAMEPMLPFLRLAEFTGVGSSAAKGLGQVCVVAV